MFSSLTRRYVTLRIAYEKLKSTEKMKNSSIWLASNTLLLNWYRSMLVVITSCLVDFLELIQPRSFMHSFPGILNIPDSYVSFSNLSRDQTRRLRPNSPQGRVCRRNGRHLGYDKIPSKGLKHIVRVEKIKGRTLIWVQVSVLFIRGSVVNPGRHLPSVSLETV